MKKVKLALVGCGGRGRYMAGLFARHPLCEIVAVMDIFRRPAEEAAVALGGAGIRIFGDYPALLSQAPLDAIYFACDPLVQVELACQAMDKGIHACTDVPAAFTLDDCWKLVTTVQRTGCKYQLMEQTRYWGFIETWKRMNDAGEFGHVCLAQGEYVHYSDKWNFWRDRRTGEFIHEPDRPAGRETEPTWRYKVLGDPIYYLPHTLSPLLKILGDRVERVSCMGTRPRSYTDPEHDLPWRDIEYAVMHTAKDTVLIVGAGFSLPHVPRGPLGCHWYELRGDKASVTSPRYKGDAFRVWRRGRTPPAGTTAAYEAVPLSATPLDATAEQAQSGHGGADFKPVDTFLRAIVEDTTPPMDVFLTAEMTAPAILAAESARHHGILLEVPDFRSATRSSQTPGGSAERTRVP